MKTFLFQSRNNGFAISTPVKDQYRGDGIASRGAGYGIVTIRVDGNDLLAIHNATREAREIAVSQSRPVLIETITYRLGHHSTSDDSTVYRSAEEINLWNSTSNPIDRYGKYLINKGLWSEKENVDYDKECLDIVNFILLIYMLYSFVIFFLIKVKNAIKDAESKRLASPVEMFMDVYDKPSKNLMRQIADLKKHLKLYEDKYPLEKHEKI